LGGISDLRSAALNGIEQLETPAMQLGSGPEGNNGGVLASRQQPSAKGLLDNFPDHAHTLRKLAIVSHRVLVARVSRLRLIHSPIRGADKTEPN